MRLPAPPQVAAAAPGAPEAAAMELVFAGERCEDHRRLKHYGVCENWIAQARAWLRRAPQGARVRWAALTRGDPACDDPLSATPRRCRASWSTPRWRA